MMFEDKKSSNQNIRNNLSEVTGRIDNIDSAISPLLRPEWFHFVYLSSARTQISNSYPKSAKIIVFLCDASSGPFIITLPRATNTRNIIYRFQKTDSSTNAITISAQTKETVAGSTSETLTSQNDGLELCSNGAEWISLTIKSVPGAIDHESLAGLLGGAANDHYHLTATEKSHYDIAYALKDIITNDTGFINNSLITVTGDSATRKITLTGTVTGYYKGVQVTALTSGWVSDAHNNDTSKRYFLVYNGSFSWIDLTTTALDFSCLLIAYAFYDVTAAQWVYIREVHGLMDDESHKSDHLIIGTFKVSGGTPSGYTLDSTTAANRRPDISEVVIRDEDLQTTNSAKTDKLYTHAYLTSSGLGRFTRNQSDIIPLSGNNPYYNQFSSPNWVQTLMPNNSVASIWCFALPMCSGAECQKYRFVFGQPQWVTLAAGPALAQIDAAVTSELTRNISEMNLGDFTTLLSEMVGIIRIVIAYVSTDSNWRLKNVSVLSGSRYTQSSFPSGNFLSSVAVDGTTITGNGTPSSPLIGHTKQHAITSTADHSSTATSGKILKADANGLPVNSVIEESSGNIGVGGAPLVSHDVQGSSSSGASYPITDVRNVLVTIGDGITTQNAAQTRVQAGNGNVIVGLIASYATAGVFPSGAYIRVATLHSLNFMIQNTNRLQIDTSGNIDILGGQLKISGTRKDANWDGAASHKTTEDAINGLVKCNGAGSYSAVTDNSSNWDSAYTHKSNNGTDHSYINQSVTSSASPTFVTTTVTESKAVKNTFHTAEFSATLNTGENLDCNLRERSGIALITIDYTNGANTGKSSIILNYVKSNSGGTMQISAMGSGVEVGTAHLIYVSTTASGASLRVSFSGPGGSTALVSVNTIVQALAG